MTPQQTLAIILVISSSVFAQHVTTPKGFLNTEGNSNTTFNVGTYSDGRYQQVDGTYRGTVMTIKGTAYRYSNYIYGPTHAAGRSWTKVKILAAECDPTTFSTTFSKNYSTTPTLVFDKAMSWPTQIGKPATLPAAWSMLFPFSGNWTYTGGDDILFDYQFTGGTLMNNTAWGSTTNRAYYLDSHSYPTYLLVNSGKLGFYGYNLGCNDRGVAHVYGADIWSQVGVYSQDYSNATLRGKLSFSQSGRYFPGNRPMLTVIGFKSLLHGVSFPGVTCNGVHIDMSYPIITVPSFTNSSGTLVTLNLSSPNPGLADVELVSQVIWSDSVNGSPLLSNAANLLVPAEPLAQPTKLLYHYAPAATTGWMTASRGYIPVIRYDR